MHFDHLPMTGQSGLTYAHSVQSFMIAQEAARYTPKTLEIYRHVLGRFAEDLGSDAIPVADISPTSIRAHLIKSEQRGLKDTTVHHHARHLKAFLNWLVREELLADSPVRKVTMPRVAKRVHEAFTKEQLEALLVATSCKTAWGANQTEAYIASRRPRLGATYGILCLPGYPLLIELFFHSLSNLNSTSVPLTFAPLLSCAELRRSPSMARCAGCSADPQTRPMDAPMT